MDKKKILFYYKLFFAGGTEHSILKLIKKLNSEFDIIVAYDEESTENVLKEIRKYAEVINLNDIENIKVDKCIVCSHSRLGSFEYVSNKITAEHYYYWCHLVMFETFPNLEFKQDIIDNMERFICVSDKVKDDIIRKYPELEPKCKVLENYLDINEIIKKSEEEVELKLDSNTLNIISVSRIAKDKGFARMKQVCDILDNKNISYNWYVLGTSYKKEELDEITGWFKNNNNVHFIGYKDNVYPYIKQMDYLALLTDREAWGLVISEALILGVPCIATNFDGVEKQIIDKENGIILDMENKDNCYEKRIDDIIELKEILKKNVIKKEYSREKIISEWIKILKN